MLNGNPLTLTMTKLPKDVMDLRNDREHPNFISLKDDVFTSNILLPTMFAMINTEVNRGMLI
jgi:hypothetical protein